MNSNINKTVVVAMSGGVDSSVAAALLKEQGYNLIGITMKTWGFDDFPEKDSGCCSLETIYSAKNVAHNLGFPHYTLDFTEKFNDIVISNFISEYLKGNTPNPCVLCNKAIKWGALLEKAESLGADYIATGHYAKVNYNEIYKRFIVSAANDNQKDQSYALWRVSQYALSKTLFPLSNYTKSEIRNIAREMGLKPADTPDSQEICFVPNDDYRELIQIRLPELSEKLSGGDILYHDKKIGTHKGYPYYTIGQRRGLNVAIGKKIYVSGTDPEKNIVTVDDESGLFHSGFTANEINLMMFDKIESPVKAKVKIRYNDKGSEALIEQTGEDLVKVTFDSPQKAITPGQSAVFYSGNDLIGGGIIDKVF
ncbi:MAG: tRNA 2-thiouridine(34) synthase MnmA [Ignavibacteria bacterium]|nr:tRNA 2-thiouridine(34) synthase MnmA [Ignavibacteria bacterium]MBK7253302.1 tRNA 2-thiouridine(34) synthase MnmA [Ignavibacteria bacterium]MBK7446607.1 tRNA 2-thiouridine(34) synthase MnmA [Ignavibacteria bacterium]MBK9405665.1 tRNA 2-thiouridine(34) synthase MnmA [Ignavibacteria bacterium]MBL0106459.1 tRNA 2-thiouridine(34) synthase MnmA [Ignavibacteria bacterium]